MAGRLVELTGGVAHFADDLPLRVAEAESNLLRVLDAVDAYAERTGLVRETWPPERPPPVPLRRRRPVPAYAGRTRGRAAPGLIFSFGAGH